MEREKEVGTDLASHASEMASMRFQNVRRTLVRASFIRWLNKRNFVQFIMLGAFLALLWLAGLSLERFLMTFAGVLLAAVPQAYMRVKAKQEQFDPYRFYLTHAFTISGTLLMVLATGGLLSPAFFILVMIGWTLDVPFGVLEQTHRFAIFTATVTLGLLLIPDAWLGPPLASPYLELLVALASIATGIPLHLGLTLLLDAHIQAGERLERLREQLLVEATSRARSLESISSKVAHELKNPLASIKGMAQLVLRSTENEPNRGRLEVIVEEAARMEVILREYLSFARPLEDLRPQQLDLGMLVGDVLAIIEARAATGGVALSLAGEGHVVADPRRIKEAMLNLIQNAVQATPPGGTVHAEIDELDDGASIIIRDSGAGMNPETLAKLGTPFYTTRSDGTGLGVVLARAAVAQHGGRVSFESQLGLGTTVTVIIPREPKAAPNGTSPSH